MSENKRFYKAYCCGDTGVIDKLENEWFIENINSISDIEKNWDTVIDKLNQVAEENEKLKLKVNGLKSELTIWKEDANEHIQETNKLFEENKQLKNKCGNYKQALLDLGINTNILDGTGVNE